MKQACRLAALLSALGLLFGMAKAGPTSAPAASAAPVQYFSGVLCGGCWHWDQGWNDHVYNEAYHAPSGPYVSITEHHTDGHWVYYYGGPGNVDICHPPSYTEVACQNYAPPSISVTCFKETVAC